MRRRQQTEPVFEFVIDENAESCGSALDILCDILIDIEESKRAERTREPERGDACPHRET
jgi:hypothetical protein